MRHMFRALLISIVISLGLVTLAAADSHPTTLVVTTKHDDLTATVTLATKSPKAGQDVVVTLNLVRATTDAKTHKRTTEAVADAAAQAHLGHGKDVTDVALKSGSEGGTYLGTIKFDHEGKETFHVGITTPGHAKEWLVRIAVTVAHDH